MTEEGHWMAKDTIERALGVTLLNVSTYVTPGQTIQAYCEHTQRAFKATSIDDLMHQIQN